MRRALEHGTAGTAPGRSGEVGCSLVRRLREQLAADQHAADLAGAGADLVELGVAQQAARRVVVDVAVAAEQLDRVERHLGGLLGRVEDGAGGVLAGRLAAVAGLGDRIDIGLGRIHGHVHVGDLALHELELADRPGRTACARGRRAAPRPCRPA